MAVEKMMDRVTGNGELPAVAIACGGTGGHFFPGLAIARALRAQGARPVLFIAGHHQAKQMQIAAGEGFAVVAADALRAPNSVGSAVRFLWKFPAAIWATRKALRQQRVAAALGMGSFASAPLCLAARLAGLPLYLHEGNTTAGKANRNLARFARTFMLSFPLTNPPAVSITTRLVGMPVRQELVTAAAEPLDASRRAALRTALGLDPALPTLLMFGGSQGAKAINGTLVTAAASLPAGLANRFQVILLTGVDDNTATIAALRAAGIRASVESGTPAMADRYRAADAVICRAGASTIAELCLFAIGAILVPFPAAADNHQQTNADWAVATGGATCCRESEFTPSRLATLLAEFANDPTPWHRRGQALAAHARPNAATEAASELRKAL